MVEVEEEKEKGEGLRWHLTEEVEEVEVEEVGPGWTPAEEIGVRLAILALSYFTFTGIR